MGRKFLIGAAVVSAFAGLVDWWINEKVWLALTGREEFVGRLPWVLLARCPRLLWGCAFSAARAAIEIENGKNFDLQFGPVARTFTNGYEGTG
jgi:hypothetical protein